MAYPTVSAPYGLLPVNRIDGMPYAGATRILPVASGNALLCNGDVLTLSQGTVDKMTSGTAGVSVGVCVGGNYNNSMNQPIHAQSIPASTAGATAYIVDDPMALFKVAVVNGGGDITGVSSAVIGSNMALVIGSGNSTTGDSTTAVLAGSEDDTAALPVRVIDVVTETATGSNSFVELLVKLNSHQYNNTTGVV